LREELLGPEHPETLTSMNNLVRVLRRLGISEKSEVMHQQALELRKKVLSPHHQDSLRSMDNLVLVIGN
jgi:hypothetical protein